MNVFARQLVFSRFALALSRGLAPAADYDPLAIPPGRAATQNLNTVIHDGKRDRDIPGVLDQLERWNAAREHPLAGRLDLARVGMSGHSFEAVTTQAPRG